MGRKRKEKRAGKHAESTTRHIDWNDPWDAFEAVQEERERENARAPGRTERAS